MEELTFAFELGGICLGQYTLAQLLCEKNTTAYVPQWQGSEQADW